MIEKDVFIFDNVVHMYDYSDENLKSKDIIPTLAAIIVGNDSASKLYVSSKAKIFSYTSLK